MTSIECQGDYEGPDSSICRVQDVQKSELQTFPDTFLHSVIASTNSLPFSF